MYHRTHVVVAVAVVVVVVVVAAANLYQDLNLQWIGYLLGIQHIAPV